MQLLHKFAGGGGWQIIVRLQEGVCPSCPTVRNRLGPDELERILFLSVSAISSPLKLNRLRLIVRAGSIRFIPATCSMTGDTRLSGNSAMGHSPLSGLPEIHPTRNSSPFSFSFLGFLLLKL